MLELNTKVNIDYYYIVSSCWRLIIHFYIEKVSTIVLIFISNWNMNLAIVRRLCTEQRMCDGGL